MSKEHRCGSWVEHFPDNLRWSNATQIVKGMAPWGAVAIGEIDQAGERMKARARAGEDADTIWRDEWTGLAARVEKIADEAAAKGHNITAGNHYMRAGNYYYSGERFVPPGEEKLGWYRKALRCYHGALERLYPQVEKVDVPYENGALAAYFMKSANAAPKAPTVVLFNGMDNCKEMSVIFAGIELAKRGIHTLAIDGPGQGESLRLRKFHSRHDYEVAGTAAYELVSKRPDVDPKRVIIMGYSFGGYLAPRVVGFEKRYAACVAFGAMQWDLHGWQAELKRLLAADPKTSFSSSFQFRWVLGAPDNETALEWAKKFSLEGVAENITCPFLVVHGENDRIVPLAEAVTLYEKVGSKNKHLKIFKVEEGGAEHCQVDNRQMGVDYIGDWILDNV